MTTLFKQRENYANLIGKSIAALKLEIPFKNVSSRLLYRHVFTPDQCQYYGGKTSDSEKNESMLLDVIKELETSDKPDDTFKIFIDSLKRSGCETTAQLLSDGFTIEPPSHYFKLPRYVEEPKLNNSRFKQYVGEASRLGTFRIFEPQNGRVDVRELAHCGFFYEGPKDACRCFYCGTIVRNWPACPNPIDIHAQHNINCDWLITVHRFYNGYGYTSPTLNRLQMSTAEQQYDCDVFENVLKLVSTKVVERHDINNFFQTLNCYPGDIQRCTERKAFGTYSLLKEWYDVHKKQEKVFDHLATALCNSGIKHKYQLDYALIFGKGRVLDENSSEESMGMCYTPVHNMDTLLVNLARYMHGVDQVRRLGDSLNLFNVTPFIARNRKGISYQGTLDMLRKWRQHETNDMQYVILKSAVMSCDIQGDGMHVIQLQNLWKQYEIQFPHQALLIKRDVLSPQMLDDDDDERACVICLDNKRNILIVPCHHLCLCNRCSHTIKEECPLCRGPVNKKILVYN